MFVHVKHTRRCQLSPKSHMCTPHGVYDCDAGMSRVACVRAYVCESFHFFQWTLNIQMEMKPVRTKPA